MKGLHRFVVLFGVFSVVGVATLAGSVAEASNVRSVDSRSHNVLVQKIQDLNRNGDGCRQ